MKAVTTLDLEPFPKKTLSAHNSPSGILNSEYKSIVKKNFRNMGKPSLFGIKQRLKSKQYSMNCGVEATLKISLFLIGLIFAFN